MMRRLLVLALLVLLTFNCAAKTVTLKAWETAVDVAGNWWSSSPSGEFLVEASCDSCPAWMKGAAVTAGQRWTKTEYPFFTTKVLRSGGTTTISPDKCYGVVRFSDQSYPISFDPSVKYSDEELGYDLKFKCESNPTTEQRRWSSLQVKISKVTTVYKYDEILGSYAPVDEFTQRSLDKIEVIQEGRPAAISLLTDAEKIDVDYKSNKGTIKVTSNFKWDVSTDAEWIKLSKDGGAENGSVDYSIDANDVRQGRTGEIVFTADGIERRIAVSQDEYRTPDFCIARPDGWIGAAYLTNERGSSTPRNHFLRNESAYFYFGLANCDSGRFEGKFQVRALILDGLGIVVNTITADVDPAPQPSEVIPSLLTLPMLDIGTYKIRFEIDSGGQVAETSEDNNTIEIPFSVVTSLPSPLPSPIYCGGEPAEPDPPSPPPADGGSELFEYEVYSGDSIWICSYKGRERDVVIPSYIENLPVRRIDGLRPDDATEFNVESVTLPNTLRTIAQFAFSGCDKLASIRIPASVNYIQEAYLAFYGCSSLKAIDVASGNEEYRSANGCLLSKDGKTFLLAPPGRTEVSVPAGVKVIEDNAFSDGKVASVSIPEGVEELRFGVFAGARELTDVTIPSTVKKLGKSVFWKASSLKAVRFKGDAPEYGSSLYEGTPASLVTYVTQGSTGWLESGSSELPYVWPLDDSPRAIRFAEESPKFYTISYLSNGGSGVMSNQTVGAGRVWKLPPCNLKPPADKTRFAGWSCSNGRRYDDEMLVFDLGNVVMTAIWE